MSPWPEMSYSYLRGPRAVWPSYINMVPGSSPDPGYDRPTDPDMALSCNLGPEDTIVPVAGRPSNTNMATECGLNSRHLCGLWWYHRPQTSQTLTVLGPWTEKWPLNEAQAQMLPLPWESAKAIQMIMASKEECPLETNMDSGV